MRYGYARVSSPSQNIDEQIRQLTEAGCTVIRSEKISGTSTENRPELATLLDFLRPGDELWITRIDRIARSIRDLSNIVDRLKKQKVTLRATQQSIDTATPAGVAFLSMLGVFAEFETAIRAERQREGIEAAKRAGAYIGKGRKATIKPEQVAALLADGLAPNAICAALKISRSSFYRLAPPTYDKTPK